MLFTGRLLIRSPSRSLSLGLPPFSVVIHHSRSDCRQVRLQISAFGTVCEHISANSGVWSVCGGVISICLWVALLLTSAWSRPLMVDRIFFALQRTPTGADSLPFHLLFSPFCFVFRGRLSGGQVRTQRGGHVARHSGWRPLHHDFPQQKTPQTGGDQSVRHPRAPISSRPFKKPAAPSVLIPSAPSGV